MPAKNVAPVVVYLSPEDKDALKALADREGRTTSGEARRAIEQHLETDHAERLLLLSRRLLPGGLVARIEDELK